MIEIQRFSVEYSTKKIITDEKHPTFSFELFSDENDVEIENIIFSLNGWRKEFLDERVIKYEGEPLKPFTKYVATLSLKTTNKEEASQYIEFETGFLGTRWKGKWISDPKYKFVEKKVSPKPLAFQKEIKFEKDLIKSIKLYATALGVYSVFINENKVSDRYFAPGFTSYKTNLMYQVYDLTNDLKNNDKLNIVVAGGWAIGCFVMNRKNRNAHDRQALKAELLIEYEDGSVQIIPTDETWLVNSKNQFVASDFYDGETYDARLGFDKLEYHKATLEEVSISPTLKADYGVEVIEHEVFKPKYINKINGREIYDFGQNFAGIVRFKAKNLKEGQEIIIRHAEVLTKDGELDVKLLRSAKASLHYIAKGEKEEIYSPTFTYMGFRYIDITGINKEDIEIEGVALYSDLDQYGDFNCSNELINRLQKNIEWSSKSNFIDIPTDCPQRDERMGRTGDINVFSRTAYFNFDMTRFLNKWIEDVRAEQGRGGGIPNTVPKNGYGFPLTMPLMAIDFWGDACINVPYNVYFETGDLTSLTKNFEMMKSYVKAEAFWSKLFSLGDNRYIFKTINMLHFGDWVAPDVIKMSSWQARHKWTATASMKLCSDKVSEIAKILKNKDDEIYFNSLSEATAKAYVNKLTDGNGKLLNEFQTGYVLPIYFDIFDKEMSLKAASNLANLVKTNNYCIGTGFPGTPYILFALLDNKQEETAYKMLFNTSCPSWLYEVKVGATTIWERWDGLKEDGTANVNEDGTGGMISFNHYASGAVGDFLYRRIAGIEAVEPGYKRFKIEPKIPKELTYANAYTHCLYGKISSSWKIVNDKFALSIEVPIGTECEVKLPSGKTIIVKNGNYNFEENMENI